MKSKILFSTAVLILISFNSVFAQKTRAKFSEKFKSVQSRSLVKKSDMGNPDSSMFYNQSGLNGPLVETRKEVYTYDANGNIIKIIYKTAQGDVMTQMDSIIYDVNGREIEYYSFFDFNGEFRITDIDYSKYDASGFFTIYSSFIWDGYNYRLDYNDSSVLEFDSENRLTVYKSFEASSSTNYQFEPVEYIEFSYNGTEETPITVTISGYDKNLMNFVPTEKIDDIKWRINTTNLKAFEEGNFTEAFYYQFSMGNWLPRAFDSSIVNNNRIETRFNYEWNGNTIVPEYRTVYTYDSKNTLIKNEFDSYILGNWVNAYSEEDSILYGPGDIHLDIYTTSSYLTQQGMYTSKSRRQNYFQGILGNNNKNLIIGSVYPNPSSSILNLKLNKAADKAEIINLEGRVIQVININSDYSAVNIQNLTPGMYILRLSNHDGVQNIKFIKQ